MLLLLSRCRDIEITKARQFFFKFLFSLTGSGTLAQSSLHLQCLRTGFFYTLLCLKPTDPRLEPRQYYENLKINIHVSRCFLYQASHTQPLNNVKFNQQDATLLSFIECKCRMYEERTDDLCEQTPVSPEFRSIRVCSYISLQLQCILGWKNRVVQASFVVRLFVAYMDVMNTRIQVWLGRMCARSEYNCPCLIALSQIYYSFLIGW